MLRSIVSYLRPPAIRDAAALERFLSGEASYLAQRATYEFTRNTLAWFGQSAFADTAFNAQFRVCRWESFAAVLSGFVTVGADRLRTVWTGTPDRLADALTGGFGRMLGQYDTPAHRTDWTAAEIELRERLAGERLPGIESLARIAAERAFATAPARSANESEDRKVLMNAMQFGMIAFQDRWDRRVDLAAICVALSRPGRAEP